MADLRGIVKWFLFLSSYIPLYLILTFKHWSIKLTPDTAIPVVGSFVTQPIPIVSVLWILLSVISFVVLLLVLSVRKSKEGDRTTIQSYKSRSDLITTYILVYIFPFVVLDFSDIANWLAFLVFFIVIGVVQVRSNQLYVNPVLAIPPFRYDIYEIDTGERQAMLVTKYDLRTSPESLEAVELSNGVYITV